MTRQSWKIGCVYKTPFRKFSHICGIIGKLDIWRFAIDKIFNLAVLSTVWKETHAYRLNDVHLIW